MEITRLRPTNQKEFRAVRNIVHAAINLYQEQYDSMALSNVIDEKFNIHIDWHDVSTALDNLSTHKLIERKGTNSAGLALYSTL